MKLRIIVDTRATELIWIHPDGPASSITFTPGGVELCEIVTEHLKSQYQFLISRLSAERAILSVGCVQCIDQERMIEITGRNMANGLPQRRQISTGMIEAPIAQVFNVIVRKITRQISFNISVNFRDTGLENELILSGDYSRLRGLREYLEDAIRAEAIPEARIVVEVQPRWS